ncbi:MAG: ArnT family glycosyltransferase [Acidobacteriota bacterium]
MSGGSQVVESAVPGTGARALTGPVLLTAAAVALACTLAGGLAPLTDRDESRYAGVVRAMRSTGDLLVPRLDGRLFPDKPPLSYWLQAASTALLGESELALRLPSALSAGLLILLTAGLAARLGTDPRLAGTLVLPGALVMGALAIPDALATMLTALALLAFLRAADGVERVESAALGWVALAAGILVKGPVAPLFVGAALAGRLWREGAAARRLGWWWGVPLCAALVLAWFVPAELATGGELGRLLVGRHIVGRALTPLEHHGAGGILGVVLGPPFYLLALAIGALPVIPAAFRFVRVRRTLPPATWRTTAAGVVIPLLAFSLAATKLPHYVLPALPLLAVAAAAAGAGRCARVTGWVLGAACLVALVAVARLAPWRAAGEAIAARGGALVTAAVDEPSLRVYAHGSAEEASLGRIWQAAQHGPVRALMTPGEIAILRTSAPTLRIRPLESWRGINLAKGRRVEVELVELGPSP